MKQRAAIYARYSCTNQREESIEVQIKVCTEKALEDGFDVVAVYFDKAISGKTADRPDFLRMISESAAGDWSRLYVYKTDRFARNRYDSATYKNKLRRNGVQVVCACESIPDGPDGIILESVLEGMAEWYSANLSENVSLAMNENARNGKANGCTIFGLDINDQGFYELNQAEADMLRNAAETWLAGGTLKYACDKDCANFRTRKGGKITPNFLSRAFKRKKYRGIMTWGGIEVPDAIPRVFDEDLAYRLDAKMGADGRNRRVAMEYLLSGIVYDKYGNKFWANSGHGRHGGRYNYYRCEATKQTFRQDDLEGMVFEALRDALAVDGIADMIADVVIEAQEEACADDIDVADQIERKIAQVKRERKNLINLVAKMGVDDETAEQIAALRDQENALELELMDVKRKTPKLTRDHVLFWLESVTAARDIQTLIPTFVSRVIVEDSGIRIESIIKNLADERLGSGLLPVVHHEHLIQNTRRAIQLYGIIGGFGFNVMCSLKKPGPAEE